LDIFGQAGLGIKFKIPRGFLFLEARANMGFFDQNKGVGTNTDLLQNYYFYTSPDFRLNALNINIGYTYIFYKPSKKKA